MGGLRRGKYIMVYIVVRIIEIQACKICLVVRSNQLHEGAFFGIARPCRIARRACENLVSFPRLHGIQQPALKKDLQEASANCQIDTELHFPCLVPDCYWLSL